jgi:peptidoglycan/xylan/chitin deacetylase (PgdA/CDA1 family)
MNMRKLPSHGRYEHSSIVGRPVYDWPNGARLAVYFALGVEHYAFNEGMVENLVPGIPAPDVLNTSWREYGNRVGAWRVLKAFAEDYKLPLSILLNTAVYDEAPDLLAACRKAGCEIIAHGFSNSEMLAGRDEADEAAYIRGITDSIVKAEGQRPFGWASPWIAETMVTPDILDEAGYSYLLDWCMDDQPVWMKTRKGRILSVPYSQELNDSSSGIGRQLTGNEFADMIVDQFDEMLRSSRESPQVMSVITHSFISGQPFRLRALRRALDHIMKSAGSIWFTQPGQIAAHIASLQSQPEPSSAVSP